VKLPNAALSLAILVASLTEGSAFAEAYPSKPIRLIIPTAAGSAVDIRGRWIAERLTRVLGQPVVADNRAGAGGTVGTDAAAKSAPDGYTLLVVHQGTMVLAAYTYPGLTYDPITDFAPITRLSVNPLLLAVHQSVPVSSVADLVRLAREKPGQLSYGSPGSGTPPHLAGELFKNMANIDVMHIPYKGGGPAVTDLVAGRLTYTFDNLSIQLPQIKAGKIKPLAVTGARRLPSLPDVPTLAESGLAGYDFLAWMGIAAPARTPQEIVARLSQETTKILATSEAREWLAAQGAEPGGESPTEFAAYIKAEHAKWGPIIRKAGIKAD
jgi:tripartite-type tricarboxylate transporter receptor subunit TctC